MKPGFLLFIDEAGDEGITRVRPIHPDGSPEYFVISGVLIRSHRHSALESHLKMIKLECQLRPNDELHFRKLNSKQQDYAIKKIGAFPSRIISIVSNKRNMQEYRNRRVESKSFEVDRRGNVRAQSNNWFYNNMLRYLFERASAECKIWTQRAYGDTRPIRVVLSRRIAFSYSQLRAYLHKLKVERRDNTYYNNKGSIDWSVFDPNAIEALRSKNEPGLQFVDCIASAIHRAVDEDWYGHVKAGYIADLLPRFATSFSSPKDYGFKLLPDGFAGPLSANQRDSLRQVGYFN